MGDQLLQYHVYILQEFSDEWDIFQVSTNGSPEFGGENFIEAGESFKKVLEESVNLVGHEESVKLTEEFSASNKEFFREELLVRWEVMQNVVESSLQFSRDEFANFLESFKELSKEVGNGFGEQFTEALSEVIDSSSKGSSKVRARS